MSSTRLVAVLALLLMARLAPAQTLSGEQLVKALRQGGYVLVLRHASSPREAPSKELANADNIKLERQLDEGGRSTATALGKALRDLRIPVGRVFTSPTYRALETVKFAQLPTPQVQAELGDGDQSMGSATAAQSAWLRKQVLDLPTGSNTILVTHLQNMVAALPQETPGPAEGETLVFGPDGRGGAALLTRIKIEQWPTMKF